MILHLPNAPEISYFFIEINRFIFKVKSSNTKTEVTDEGRRPDDLATIEIDSIEHLRTFVLAQNMQADDVIFCISFLAKLKSHYP